MWSSVRLSVVHFELESAVQEVILVLCPRKSEIAKPALI